MKTNEPTLPLRVGDDENDIFDRARRIQWLDLETVGKANILVVGAGATGNETAKNLILSGFRNLTLIDMDRVEKSNLNRCLFFNERDAAAKRFKAEVIAERMRQLSRDARIEHHIARIQEMPEGFIGGFDAVLGCTDNVEARIHINAGAYAAGVPYIDCGTLGTSGKVQVVIPRETPCIECAMNSTHMKVLNLRYSCTGKDVTFFQPKLGAEITTTSVVSAYQVRELLKIISGKSDRTIKHVFYYDALSNISDVLNIEKNEGCSVCGH